MIIDVVLITYGEPPRASFLEQWRYSNRILMKLTRRVAPIPKFAVPLLGAWRGYNRRKTWRAENYASPLEEITQRQTAVLQKMLHERRDGHIWRVHVAYEFRDPSLETVLQSLVNQKSERLILLPMYLPISDFTSGISQRDFQQFQQRNGCPLPEAKTVTFRKYHLEISRIQAEFVRRQIRSIGWTTERCRQAGLLLGCHGTVMTPPPGIADAGYCDTKQAYDNLERELHSEFQSVAIGWLNHRLGGEWTSPTLETSARVMLEGGIREFVYFPFGFLADNAETQLEGRVALRNVGIESYHHLPCVNDDAAFLNFVAGCIVKEAGI